MDLSNVVFIVALVLGFIIISASIWIYLKTRKLGRDGLIFTIVGVILLGLSVFQNISLSGAGIQFNMDMKKDYEEIKQSFDSTQTKISIVNEENEKLKNDIVKLDPLITQIQQSNRNSGDVNKLRESVDSIKTKSTQIGKSIKEVKSDGGDLKLKFNKMDIKLGVENKGNQDKKKP